MRNGVCKDYGLSKLKLNKRNLKFKFNRINFTLPDGLIYFKNIIGTNLVSDFSVGSKSYIFTSAKSVSAASTYYFDKKVYLFTSPNIPRISKGAYKSTGWVDSSSYLMIEGDSTNYVLNSFMSRDSDANGRCDNISTTSGLAGTVTYTSIVTNPEQTVTDLTDIPGAGYQRVQYTSTADSSKTIYLYCTVSGTIISAGERAVTSVYAKGTMTGCNFKTAIITTDAEGHWMSTSTSVATLSATEWKRPTHYFTVVDITSSITAFADNGDGKTLVTSTNSFGTGDLITISGTTNYNGDTHVESRTASQFVINKPFVADDATGTATQYATKFYSGVYVDSVSTGDSFDFSYTMLQGEKETVSSYIPSDTEAMTRPAEDYKIKTLNNRSNNEETVFIGFFTLNNGGAEGHTLHSTDGDNRFGRYKSSTGNTNLQPNYTDSGSSSASGSISFTTMATYIYTGVCKHRSPYAQTFINGIAKHSDTVDDYINPDYGEYFYIGSNQGTDYLDGGIFLIAIFDRALDSVSILNTSKILYNLITGA